MPKFPPKSHFSKSHIGQMTYHNDDPDEERVAATRDYHKRYYETHREILVERSRRWRADRRAAREQPVQPVADQAAN